MQEIEYHPRVRIFDCTAGLGLQAARPFAAIRLHAMLHADIAIK
jgi:hypothetical protein